MCQILTESLFFIELSRSSVLLRSPTGALFIRLAKREFYYQCATQRTRKAQAHPVIWTIENARNFLHSPHPSQIHARNLPERVTMAPTANNTWPVYPPSSPYSEGACLVPANPPFPLFDLRVMTFYPSVLLSPWRRRRQCRGGVRRRMVGCESSESPPGKRVNWGVGSTLRTRWHRIWQISYNAFHCEKYKWFPKECFSFFGGHLLNLHGWGMLRPPTPSYRRHIQSSSSSSAILESSRVLTAHFEEFISISSILKRRLYGVLPPHTPFRYKCYEKRFFFVRSTLKRSFRKSDFFFSGCHRFYGNWTHFWG